MWYIYVFIEWMWFGFNGNVLDHTSYQPTHIHNLVTLHSTSETVQYVHSQGYRALRNCTERIHTRSISIE